MSASIAEEIVLIFSVMFTIISIGALLFAYSTFKQKHKKELQEKRMDIIDKHFNSMIRIECPYCKTIYTKPTQTSAQTAKQAPKKYCSQKSPQI
ncbi:MAG: hypothetical protein NWF06_03635 [Candidatus Bathyarchaeota archaeon]|nr:hypothetical protein [Candidatus Bathyarchaeum sp.]